MLRIVAVYDFGGILFALLGGKNYAILGSFSAMHIVLLNSKPCIEVWPWVLFDQLLGLWFYFGLEVATRSESSMILLVRSSCIWIQSKSYIEKGSSKFENKFHTVDHVYSWIWIWVGLVDAVLLVNFSFLRHWVVFICDLFITKAVFQNFHYYERSDLFKACWNVLASHSQSPLHANFLILS